MSYKKEKRKKKEKYVKYITYLENVDVNYRFGVYGWFLERKVSYCYLRWKKNEKRKGEKFGNG